MAGLIHLLGSKKAASQVDMLSIGEGGKNTQTLGWASTPGREDFVPLKAQLNPEANWYVRTTKVAYNELACGHGSIAQSQRQPPLQCVVVSPCPTKVGEHACHRPSACIF